MGPYYWWSHALAGMKSDLPLIPKVLQEDNSLSYVVSWGLWETFRKGVGMAESLKKEKIHEHIRYEKDLGVTASEIKWNNKT